VDYLLCRHPQLEGRAIMFQSIRFVAFAVAVIMLTFSQANASEQPSQSKCEQVTVERIDTLNLIQLAGYPDYVQCCCPDYTGRVCCWTERNGAGGPNGPCNGPLTGSCICARR
jgi:hypothetical protein